jgi:hypothetical protein
MMFKDLISDLLYPDPKAVPAKIERELIFRKSKKLGIFLIGMILFYFMHWIRSEDL